MAHKSIADQILMDLKKEKEDAFKKNQNACIEFMQKKAFDKYLAENIMLKADTEYDIEWRYISTESRILEQGSFINVCESLGFIVNPKSPTTISFSIPKKEKGKKQTYAQKMLSNYIIAYNQKMKERNQLAQAEINRVWDHIKERDFASTDNNDGTFTISVTLSENRAKEICDKKLIKFLSDRAFPNATIDDNTLNIVLGKKEN
ncbi:MAG: hypothetical protein IJE59_00490 [Clostridia bacterium]|nr:hypothetical protein [Clostridia bacterium]